VCAMPTAVQEEFGITAAADAITAQKTPMDAEHTLHHRISDERRAKRDQHQIPEWTRLSRIPVMGVFFRTQHRHFRGRSA